MTAAPDYAEPVVAWRTWLAVRAGGAVMLSSVLFPTLWLPRNPLVAGCLRGPSLLERLRKKERHHSAPRSACACGIYGAWLKTAISYLATPPTGGRNVVGRVIGVVSLWGAIVESDAGWRASHAYPRRLFVPSVAATTAVLAGLAAYRVPVDVFDAARARDVAAALAAFDPLR